ncbi:MAG: HAD family hydrolase [Leptospirillia bacterium]
MISSVIFDFNGVIIDDETVHRDLFIQVLSRWNVPLSFEEYERLYLGMDDRGCLSAAWRAARGSDIPDSILAELIDEKSALYEKKMDEGLPLYEGVAPLIRELARQVPLCIVSGALRPEIEHALEKNSLASHFAFIVSAEDTPRGKPDPSGYLMARAELLRRGLHQGEPETIAVIEDSIQGIEAAKGAGLKAIGVGHTYPLSDLAMADLTVAHIRTLSPSTILSL